MRFDSIQDLSLFDKKSGTNSNTSPGESHSRKRAFSLTGYDITTIAKELMYKFGLGASVADLHECQNFFPSVYPILKAFTVVEFFFLNCLWKLSFA